MLFLGADRFFFFPLQLITELFIVPSGGQVLKTYGLCHMVSVCWYLFLEH